MYVPLLLFTPSSSPLGPSRYPRDPHLSMGSLRRHAHLSFIPIRLRPSHAWPGKSISLSTCHSLTLSSKRYSLGSVSLSSRSSGPCTLKNGSISRAALPQPCSSQSVCLSLHILLFLFTSAHSQPSRQRDRPAARSPRWNHPPICQSLHFPFLRRPQPRLPLSFWFWQSFPRQSLPLSSSSPKPLLLPQVGSPPLPHLPISFLPLAYAGSKPPQSLTPLCRAVLGLSVPSDAYMTPHERLDFVIVTTLFGVFVGTTTAFSALSAEWLVSTMPLPYVPTQFHNRPPSRGPWVTQTPLQD